MTLLNAHSRASGAACNARGAFLRRKSPFAGRTVRQVFNARRNKIHHFLSPVRISALGVKFLDMPAPVDDEMIHRDMYAPARHACPLSYSGRRIEERTSESRENTFLCLFQRFSVRKGGKKRKVRTYRSHVVNK